MLIDLCIYIYICMYWMWDLGPATQARPGAEESETVRCPRCEKARRGELDKERITR